jgi:alpha-mannosidase
VKKAEDSDKIILRLYEFKNTRSRVSIKFGMEIEMAYECDMMENIIYTCENTDDSISFEIMPYEIKTFMINFKK